MNIIFKYISLLKAAISRSLLQDPISELKIFWGNTLSISLLLVALLAFSISFRRRGVDKKTQFVDGKSYFLYSLPFYLFEHSCIVFMKVWLRQAVIHRIYWYTWMLCWFQKLKASESLFTTKRFMDEAVIWTSVILYVWLWNDEENFSWLYFLSWESH